MAVFFQRIALSASHNARCLSTGRVLASKQVCVVLSPQTEIFCISTIQCLQLQKFIAENTDGMYPLLHSYFIHCVSVRIMLAFVFVHSLFIYSYKMKTVIYLKVKTYSNMTDLLFSSIGL